MPERELALAGRFLESRIEKVACLGQAAQRLEVRPDAGVKPREKRRPERGRFLLDRRLHRSAEQIRLTLQEPRIPRHAAVDPQRFQRHPCVAIGGQDKINDLQCDAFERGDRAAALAYWQRARALAPPDSPIGEAMARSIAEVIAIAPEAAPQAAPAASAPQAAAEAGLGGAPAATLSGRVSLAPALAARVAPTDTVFVFARAAEGPRMPLAIRRFPASALPLDFTLDDATAMSPELKLSRFDRVVVGARISKSGDALPQSGDLLTQTEPLAPGRSGLELVIDRVQP